MTFRAAQDRPAAALELPADLRGEVDALVGRLDAIDHYAVLGLAWGAGAADARAAYLERVRRFHPDRHGGRRLGPYHAKLDAIVRRLTEARDVLADDARRAAYEDRTAPPEERARRDARRVADAERADERRARLARTNPLVARAGRAQGLLARAKAALAAGQHAAALTDLATVLAIDPRHPEARALAGEARRRAEGDRVRDLYEDGLRHDAAGRDALALERFCAAADLAANDPRPAAAASRAALRLGRGGEARRLAEAAVRAGPAHARSHLALGAALAASGDRAGARGALERALELDGGLAEARELLKTLRWSPFR